VALCGLTVFQRMKNKGTKEHRRKNNNNNNNNNRNCIMLCIIQQNGHTALRQCGLLEINYRNGLTAVVRLRHCRCDSVTTYHGTRLMRSLDHRAVATAHGPRLYDAVLRALRRTKNRLVIRQRRFFIKLLLILII